MRFPADLCSDTAFRIEQLGKAGIVSHVSEIGIVAGLEAVAGIEPDCFGQVLETLAGAAGKTFKHGEAVPDKVQSRTLGRQVLKVLTGSYEVAEVHKRDGEVVVLLWSVEGVLNPIRLLIANID